jgi:hypothetical protein
MVQMLFLYYIAILLVSGGTIYIRSRTVCERQLWIHSCTYVHYNETKYVSVVQKLVSEVNEFVNDPALFTYVALKLVKFHLQNLHLPF